MIRIIIPAAFVFSLWSTPSYASSEELIKACRLYTQPSLSLQDAWTASHCYSYFNGYWDAWTTAQAKSQLDAGGICFPSGVSWQQIARVYINWSDKHPELWHRDPWETVLSAFTEAFPCT